jgi:hypothetical protein
MVVGYHKKDRAIPLNPAEFYPGGLRYRIAGSGDYLAQ